MWQLWFLYWGVFIITLIVFFIPNISTGQFQSIWLAVAVCACPQAHADLLSKNWASGHFESPRVTYSSAFCCCLLLNLQLHFPVWFASVSLPLPSLVSHFHSSSLYFPTSQIFLCSVMQGWDCTQPLPGTSRAWPQFPVVICAGHLQCCAAGRQHTLVGLKASFLLKPLSSWKSVAFEKSGGVGVILTQAMPCLLGALLLLLIFIQEWG